MLELPGVTAVIGSAVVTSPASDSKWNVKADRLTPAYLQSCSDPAVSLAPAGSEVKKQLCSSERSCAWQPDLTKVNYWLYRT